jgi:hypothetical protein
MMLFDTVVFVEGVQSPFSGMKIPPPPVPGDEPGVVVAVFFTIVLYWTFATIGVLPPPKSPMPPP